MFPMKRESHWLGPLGKQPHLPVSAVNGSIITINQLDPEARGVAGSTHGGLLTQSNTNDTTNFLFYLFIYYFILFIYLLILFFFWGGGGSGDWSVIPYNKGLTLVYLILF